MGCILQHPKHGLVRKGVLVKSIKTMTGDLVLFVFWQPTVVEL